MKYVIGKTYKVTQFVGTDSLDFPPAVLYNADTIGGRLTLHFQIDTYRHMTLHGDDKFEVTEVAE